MVGGLILIGGDFNCKREANIFKHLEEYENLKVIDGNLAGYTRFQEYNN